ncbi:MAG: MotA/TolQ/ExbB proton channel family protein [Spirochaetia bacterium]|nr:MotA/TolQ/ExbB proton channel family protein [Spirochaetia bacterium]
MVDIFKDAALVGDVWVLYLLLAASVLSIAVVVERLMVYGKNRVDVPVFMDALAAKLEKGDIKAAVSLASSSPCVEAKVTLEGLSNMKKGHASVEEVMTSRWIRERVRLEKNLVILSTLGNNAPFIGLFGTVLGIIKAFNDLAITGQSGIAVVMSGISSALIATALGILVAIPAVIANNYFASRLKQVQYNSESLSHIVLAYLKEKGK